MARYTELFSEWLENGGQLPAIFDEIDGFAEMFKAWYADKEIGFETPILFEMKLQAYAEAHIPIYTAKINELSKLEETASSGIKKQRTRNGNETVIYAGGESQTYGEQQRTQAEQPYVSADGSAVAPSQIDVDGTHTDTRNYVDRSDVRNYNDITDTDSGYTIDEYMKYFDWVAGAAKSIIIECLNEFKPLFMVIYA